VTVALVQCNSGGSATGSLAYGQTLSVTGGFAAPTTLGNLLMVVCMWKGSLNLGVSFNENTLPIGGGYALSNWPALPGSSGVFATWDDNPTPPPFLTTATGGVLLAFIENASSMSPGQQTTFAITMNATNGGSAASSVEMHFYEFSGVAYPGVYDLTSSGIANLAQPSGAPVITFSDFFISPTPNTDLIIGFQAAGGSGRLNLPAGTGYTLGINAAVADVAQIQYQLNAPPGQTDCGFVGTEPLWGMGAIAFKAAAPTAPTVTNVAPSSGSTAGGTSVRITGTNFLPGATVTFDGLSATSVVFVSGTALLCVTPAHAAGAVDVSVTTTGGTGTLSNGYTYTTSSPPAPTVTAVIPDYGPTSGGTAVQIIGNNFESGATVDFGGSAATSVVFVSSTQLTCVTPAHALGSVTVSVTTSDGTGSLPNGFTYTSGGGGGTPTGFTPKYPPIQKQPHGLWGLEAVRNDSITAAGVKRSFLDRVDTVTVLTFANVPASDLPAWKAFEEYALTGGVFSYRPLPDYPNEVDADPMFQYPGVDNGDDASGYSTCQLVSMEWAPHFESFENFSLSMKIKLVADL